MRYLLSTIDCRAITDQDQAESGRRTSEYSSDSLMTPNYETDLSVVASASPVQNSEDERTK